ncbi:MAG: hypothetical protein JSV03_01460, partial [Planctomycetota bacterium]
MRNMDSNPKRVLVVTCAIIAALGSSMNLYGYLNNGFETEDLYVSEAMYNGGTAADYGGLFQFDRTTGVSTQLQPNESHWASLTFSGTGTNDARLFVAKPSASDYATDVIIAELDASGNTVITKILSSLLGSAPGTDISVGSLRYSSYHNTLFLGLNPDRKAVGNLSNLSMCYEINLDLNSIIKTYQGPVISMAYSSNPEWQQDYNGVFVDINSRNGTLYMCAYNLGQLVDDGRGDLIAFDTSLPSPVTTYTTLIDGTTANATSQWLYPQCPAYRGQILPDGRETIFVIQSGGTGWYKQREYYLDEVDDDGNLVERVHPEDLEWWMQRRPMRAQYESDTGIIIAPSYNGGSSRSAGIWFFNPDDSQNKFNAGDNWTQWHGFHDVASPGIQPECRMNIWPAGTQQSSGTPGSPANPAQFVYTVVNTSATTTLNYLVSDDAAWLNLDKTGGGPLPPGASEQVIATINSTGLTPGNHIANLEFTEDCSITKYTRSINLLVKGWGIDPPEPLVEGGHTEATDASIVCYLNCLNPQTYSYTITNTSLSPINYTVTETDASGNAVPPYTWLSLDKTGGGPINPGESDTLTVTLTGTGHGTEYNADCPGGPTCDAVWNGWLKFTNDQSEVEMRQVQMEETWLGDAFGHVREYLGDVAPHDPAWTAGADGPCGPGCNFNIIGVQTGSVVLDNSNPDPDYNAQNNYAFKIDEPPTGTDPVGRNGYASDVNVNPDPNLGNNNNINSRLGTTMVARIKCVRDTLMGANLWIRDDNNGGPNANEPWGAGCRVRWNASNRIYEFVNDAGPYIAGNGKADAYHIVRIIDGWGPYGTHTLKIWVDEDKFPGANPDLEVSGAVAEGERAYDAFCFGTFGGSSNSEVYYDWITFTNAGMYGPDEEESCLGRSLIPTFCPDPFADVDGDDDVDQDDFAEFQLCYTGSGGTLAEGCDCFDQEPTGGDGDVDENDYNRFQNCASGPEVPADPACDDP